MAIEALNLGKEVSSITPAKAVFATVGVLLIVVRVCFFLFYATTSFWFTVNQESVINEEDYVDICRALDR